MPRWKRARGRYSQPDSAYVAWCVFLWFCGALLGATVLICLFGVLVSVASHLDGWLGIVKR